MLYVILVVAFTVIFGYAEYASIDAGMHFWRIDRAISYCFIVMAISFYAMTIGSWFVTYRLAQTKRIREETHGMG